MKYGIVLLMILFKNPTFLSAQSNKINDTELGFTFTIPAGWEAVKNKGSYLLTSSVTSGLIVLSKEEDNASDTELINELRKGIVSGNTILTPSGEVEILPKNSYGVEMTGKLEGIPCKGYLMLFSLGNGVNGSLLAAVDPGVYDENYCVIALEIMNTIKPVNSPDIISDHPKDLGNAAEYFLGYQIASISSDGYGGSGSRSIEVIHFCPDGSFRLEESSVNVINAHGMATNAGRSVTTGSWTFNQHNGSYILTLSANGQVGDFPVQLYVDEYGDQRFLINNEHYGYNGKASCY